MWRTLSERLFRTQWLAGRLTLFARVLEVLLTSGFRLLAVELYITDQLDSHLQSYCVKCTHQLSILYLAQLENRYPLHAHTYLGDRPIYIALHSHIQTQN